MGVLYMLTGRRHAPLLAVSLHTLRTRGHWEGEVCILVGDEDGERYARRLARDPRLAPVMVHRFNGANDKGSGWANKTLMGGLSPFPRTIFLDADTAVMSERFVDLMPRSGGPDVVLTQFCEWTTQGRKMASRLERWRDVALWHVERCLSAPNPAINTGVLGFTRGAPFMADWRAMTLRNANSFICDEIAAQLVACDHTVDVLSHAYNYSPIYSPQYALPLNLAHVVHFHGKKHLRKREGRAIWMPLFTDAWLENVGGVRSWAAECDAELSQEAMELHVYGEPRRLHEAQLHLITHEADDDESD